MTPGDMMRMVRFWIYLKAEPNRFPYGLGFEVQEKSSSQGWHQDF